MFKNLIRILIAIIIIIIFFVLYLSIFGIKTSKFNEIIKSQVNKQDNRLNIDLKDVFIKLNIKERSFSLNSKEVNFFVHKESQEISNVDILISLKSLIEQNKRIEKIIINSKENKIQNLLKFIRAYKINIPALYLENSITKGNIIYNIVLNFKDNSIDKIEIDGKIIDTNLNILGKEKIEKVNLNFNYNDENIEIKNLNLKYKNNAFQSKNIITNIDNNLINIKGDFKNKINLNLVSIFLKNDIKNLLDKKILLSSKSQFEATFTKKFKIKKYQLKSKIDIDNININLKNIDIKKYVKNFDNKITLKNGEMDITINNLNKTDIKIKSKYILKENQKSKDIILNYSKSKSFEDYKFYIDLTENELSLDDINFNKKSNEEMFLDLNLLKNKNLYEIKNLKIFNNKNLFNLTNIKLEKNFKVKDFSSIEAKYYNNEGFINDILINKKNNNIKLISNKFDISKNIEKSLKTTNTTNFLNIFQDLNSSVNIDIKFARLDNDHVLKNVQGDVLIKKNKIDKANLSAKFDKKNNFIYTKKNDVSGNKVTTIFSDKAKPFVKKFKFIKGFEGGKLDYTSTSINKNLSNSEKEFFDDFSFDWEEDYDYEVDMIANEHGEYVADISEDYEIEDSVLNSIIDDIYGLRFIFEGSALDRVIQRLEEYIKEKPDNVWSFEERAKYILSDLRSLKQKWFTKKQ